MESNNSEDVSIESGSESDSENENKTEGLFEAIRENNKEKVKSILDGIAQEKVRAFINRSNELGIKPLENAVEKKSIDIVKMLLEKGADPNAQNANTKNTTLHFSITKGNGEIVKLLLKKNENGSFKWNINIDLKNKKGKTVLNLVEDRLNKKPNDSDWQLIKNVLEQAREDLSGGRRSLVDVAMPSSSLTSSSHNISSIDSSQAQGGSSNITRKRFLDGNDSDDPEFNRQFKELKVDDTYAASGVKRALHGTIYQLQLLMLFVKRGLTYHDFKLATEMDAAEKFDDVVFKYKESTREVKWTWRFLQAKHKQDPQLNKITINDLTASKDDDFSLQKYFVSFFKIKQNPEFQGNDLKDFTICTNTGFNFKPNLKRKQQPTKKDQERNELMRRWKGFFAKEDDLQEDNILYFEDEDGKVVRFENNDEKRKDVAKEIKSALEKNIQEIEKKTLNLQSALEESEAMKNIQNRIKDELKKVLEGGAVSEETLLRKVFKAEEMLQKLDKKTDSTASSIDKKSLIEAVEAVLKIDKDTNLENEKNKLESKKMKSDINKSANWTKEEKNSLLVEAKDALKRIIKAREFLPAAEWLQADEETSQTDGNKLSDLKAAYKDFDNYITEFLNKFRFVIDYPDEERLNYLIGEEVGKNFMLLNADLVTDSFQKDMLDWFKQKLGIFLLKKDAEGLFSSLKEQINTVITCGLSKAYPEKLSTYRIGFKKNSKRVSNFLFPKDKLKAKRILHVATQATRLSSIMVLDSIRSFDKYKNCDSYICIRLRTLLLPDTQNLAINSFCCNKTHDLLVIECQVKTQDKIDGLYRKLSNILNSNQKKKIILIAQDENMLAKKFEEYQKDNYQKENDRRSFKDLNENSQDKVLERNVNFQGNDISLNELIDKGSAGKIIDQVRLLILLEEKIPIGDTQAFFSIGYVESYYIKRVLYRQRINAKILEQDSDSELLFITGASEEDLNKMGVKTDNLHTWEDYKTCMDWIIVPISGQRDQEMFDNLQMKSSKKNLHWLEYQDGMLVWRASSGNLSTLNKYINDENDILDWKNGVKEEDFSEPEVLGQKVVIVANDPGAGKSTVLTSIAQEMKQKDPALWVVRINLNDYTKTGKENSLLHIDFNENDVENAIDFVTKMAIPDDSKDKNVEMQRVLFEASLRNEKAANSQEYKYPKIVILFDGFDEICPSYEAKTKTLIKALKGSNIVQLWITTRVHEKSKLEQEFESPAYILNSLTQQQQENFLTNFWKWNLKFYKDMYSQEVYERPREEIAKRIKMIELPKEFSTIQLELTDQLKSLKTIIDKLDFSDNARELLKRWKASISDTNKGFTDIPLNLRMLAEVVFENKFQLPDNVGLIGLYDTFIKIKFDIYNREKTETSVGNVGADTKNNVFSNILNYVHQELALRFFFPEKNSLPGLDKLREFQNLLEKDKQVEEELARVGLLSLKGNELDFIHRSFGEYFLSEYLIENLQDINVQKLLLEEVFFKEKYALIRKFLNDQLGLFFKYDLGQNRLSNEEPKGGLKKFEQLSSDQLTNDLVKSIEDVSEHIEKSGGSPLLQDLTKRGYEYITKFFLCKLKYNKKTFENLVLKRWSSDKLTILLAAVEGGNFDVVLAILGELNNQPSILNKLVLFTKKFEVWTALHLASFYGNTKICQVLLDNFKGKPDIFEKIMFKSDYYGYSFLDLAAQMGRNQTVTVLLDWMKENLAEEPLDTIFKKFIHKTKALNLAVENGHYQTVKILLEWTKHNLEEKQFNDLLLGKYCRQTVLTTAITLDGTIDSSTMVFIPDHGISQNKLKIINFILDNISDEIMERLAILSVYVNDQQNLKQNVDKLLTVVGETSKIGKKLMVIKGRLGEVKNKKEALDDAIKHEDDNKIQNITNTSQDYITELLLATNQYNGKNSLKIAAEGSHWSSVVCLLTAGANITDLNNNQLKALKSYVENNDYREQILDIINQELGNRFQKPGRSGGRPSKVREDSGVLRLKGGASLE